MDALSDCPSDFEINCGDSESVSLSEDSHESDIRTPKWQKKNVLESCSASDFEEWIKDDITSTSEDHSNVSGVTVEFSDALNVREVTNLLFNDDFFIQSFLEPIYIYKTNV